MPDDRTLGETYRRIDGLTEEVREMRSSIDRRFDKMPTTEVLVEILKLRDQRMDHIEEDLRELGTRFDTFVARLENTRRWLIGVVVAASGVIIAIAGFVRSVLS